jgi:hypothetical protein
MGNELKEYIAKLIKYNEYEETAEPVLTDEQCIQRFIELHEFGNKFIPRETLEKLQKEKFERFRTRFRIGAEHKEKYERI